VNLKRTGNLPWKNLGKLGKNLEKTAKILGMIKK